MFTFYWFFLFISHKKPHMWLAKVPKYLLEEWVKYKNDQDIGSIRVSEANPDQVFSLLKKSNYTAGFFDCTLE